MSKSERGGGGRVCVMVPGEDRRKKRKKLSVLQHVKGLQGGTDGQVSEIMNAFGKVWTQSSLFHQPVRGLGEKSVTFQSR